MTKEMAKRNRAALDAQRQAVKLSDPEMATYLSHIIQEYDRLIVLFERREMREATRRWSNRESEIDK